ncbi:hypothetical protein QUF64_12460 [Anaerolineales bacterium HSG6]|nr:hypothetical protein [Anaerolineales bacterium HSG6]
MMKIPNLNRIPSSFRDPSGFVFEQNGNIYRQINQIYQTHYDKLMASGLYQKLSEASLLIPHVEVSLDFAQTDTAYKVIQPKRVPFISYPYEWSFSQLKHAALATLRAQKMAFEHGMVLKDSSAYNIQFWHGKPLLIDTLSFETYQEGQIWVAYRQFCQHFLAPLALMSYTDIRLSQLFRVYIDGVPLDLASKLLPWRTRLNFGLLSNIHLHAKSQQHFADKTPQTSKKPPKMSRIAFIGLIESLEKLISKLNWKPKGTEWADYYQETNYTDQAMQTKKRLVADFLNQTSPKTVWDIGANTGLFSRLSSERQIDTVSFDIDPGAVEKNYLQLRAKNETHLLPLILDLTNPSPSIGWANQERDSFIGRGPVDTVLALALIHHLAIANNLPFDQIARFFSQLCQYLIIEFVPKSDSQVQRLLASREDIFPQYTQADFERIFSHYFTMQKSHHVEGSERTLYLMQRL